MKYNCDSCQKELDENDKFHEYQEDAIIICDECHKYYKHEIGRTG